jgi:hypothetical protein
MICGNGVVPATAVSADLGKSLQVAIGEQFLEVNAGQERAIVGRASPDHLAGDPERSPVLDTLQVDLDLLADVQTIDQDQANAFLAQVFEAKGNVGSQPEGPAKTDDAGATPGRKTTVATSIFTLGRSHVSASANSM